MLEVAADFKNAFVAGLERVAAWSDVLDDINVFPVADGDTGRNLMVSLSPLRQLGNNPKRIIQALLFSARGNSGNIAARFFSGFLKADSFENLPKAASTGRELAWKAVHDPVPGTMLTVFDALAEFLLQQKIVDENEAVCSLIDHLADATLGTIELLPKLKQAGVVDAGALGMFIYLEGFFKGLIDRKEDIYPISDVFKDVLQISTTFQQENEKGYCIDTVVHLKGDVHETEKLERLTALGESVVIIPERDYFKVHLHTDDIDGVKERIASIGDVIRWADDDIGLQIENFKRKLESTAIHVMTDAAGSITREDARRLGITLMDSYITAGDRSLPETLFSPKELYGAMRKGLKVSTSQASDFERHQYYQRILDQYPRILYLCVGSVYTGNYAVARQWKQVNDPDNRFTVLDTTAASGRLGTIVIATAKYAGQAEDSEAVIDFARRAIKNCEEYIFLDRLKYLAAGGRLSRKSAFFGDMLHLKPVVSPTAEGAIKVGGVRNRNGQLRFALDRLEKKFSKKSAPFIMLEYSDNRAWVAEAVQPEITRRFPEAEVILQPLSLTSGAHMGPGTWAVAFMPEEV